MIILGMPLALLALLSVPFIVILYCLRPVRRRIVTSATFLWREALAERQRGLGINRLLRDLSLLLLVICASLLAVALADPRWIGQSPRSGDLIVVLDVSASMQTRMLQQTRFERAKAQAAVLISQLPSDAQMMIIAGGAKPRVQIGFERDRRLLQRTLNELPVSDEAGDPLASLRLAMAMSAGRAKATVHFFTDGAFEAGPSLRELDVHFHTVAQAARNVAITAFDIRRRFATSEQYEVLVSVRNYTDEPVSVPLGVELDEVPLLEQRVQVAARAVQTVVLPFRGDLSGVGRARIEYEDDLSVDNAAYLIVQPIRPLRVLLFGRGSLYLKQALRALPATTTIVSDVIEDRLHVQAQRHDLLVFYGIEAPSLPPGRYMFIDSLPPGLPVTTTGRLSNQRVQGSGNSALMRDVDVRGLRVDSAVAIEIAADADPARLQQLFWSDQSPLSLAWLGEGVRLVYLGFDLQSSDFATRAAFALWFRASIDWLRPPTLPASATHLLAGERHRLWLPATQQRLVIVTPDERYIRMPVDQGVAKRREVSAVQHEIWFEQTQRTGIYRYFEGDARRYFAVNLTDAAESDVSSRAVLPNRDASADTSVRSTSETPLWHWLLAVCVLLLVIEWLVWSGRRVAT